MEVKNTTKVVVAVMIKQYLALDRREEEIQQEAVKNVALVKETVRWEP